MMAFSFDQLRRTGFVRTNNLIEGQWVDDTDGVRFAMTGPATGSLITSVPDSGVADTRVATGTAARAFPTWRNRLPAERAAILRRQYTAIVVNVDALGRLVSLEQGKPFAKGHGEVTYGASYVAWSADEATHICGDLVPQQQHDKCISTVKGPVGIVAAIISQNFPLAVIACRIAPTLAASCTVVAKSAKDTPFMALALTQLAWEAGLPSGILNMISASHERGIKAVADWLHNSRVRKITFTDSTPVGKYLTHESADTLRKLSLESGGNAPFIVFDNAGLDTAITDLLVAKLRNDGQTCVCPDRVYVQTDVYERFDIVLAGRVFVLKVVPATDSDAQVGPMINARVVDKIKRHVQNTVANGTRVLAGGKCLPDIGEHFCAPAMLAGAHSDMALHGEEMFGPVTPLFRFVDEARAVQTANDTPFRFTSYFYTQDIRRIGRVSRAPETGVAGINGGALASEATPFDGTKKSGYGRGNSKYGLDGYLSIKYLYQGGPS